MNDSNPNPSPNLNHNPNNGKYENNGERLLSARSSAEQKGGFNHPSTTSEGDRRKKWSQEVYRIVMERHYCNEPKVAGYI